MRNSIQKVLFICVVFQVNLLFGQIETDSSEVRKKALELLKFDSTEFAKNDISSINSFGLRDLRELPGYTEIITQEEIQAMGAKDLMDVLAFVTGISLGRDVEDGVGIGMRGLWSQEGKILVLLNGNPLNDLDYGTYNLGGRVPLIFVKRVEITFGTGSVKYGGTAALGVINLVLKDRQDFSGSWLNVDYSFSQRFNSRRSFSYAGNYSLDNGYQLSVNVNSTNSLRSTKYQSYGRDQVLSWGDSSKIDANNIVIGIRKNQFSASIYYGDYQYQISDLRHSVLMNQFGGDVRWDIKLNNRNSLTLQTIYIDQLPWNDINTADSSLMNSNTHSQKAIQNVWFSSKLTPKWELEYGIQAYHQQSAILLRGMVFDYNGENRMIANDIALFAESFWKSKIGTITVGSRIEKNSFTHLLYAPRIAYTKMFSNFYLKAMLVESFKIPTIQNINGSLENTRLKHETIRMMEVSMGGNLGITSNWEIAVFRNEVQDPIVFLYDYTNGSEYYSNRTLSGTSGLGFKYSYKTSNTVLKLTGHTYRSIQNSKFNEIESVSDSRSYLGMPNYRLSIIASQKIPFSFLLSSSCVYQDSFFYSSGSSEMKQQNSPLINTSISKKFLKLENLKVELGVSNILNGNYQIGSPAKADMPLMPLFNRQINLSVQYKLI
jgi:outer membrane cobalamin receptor